MKIALYLQTNDVRNRRSFHRAMKWVKNAKVDILVSPEACWVQFHRMIEKSDIAQKSDINKIFDLCESLSRELGTAVVVSSCDRFGTLFSIFSNAFASGEETKDSIYIKHTATESSAFDWINYCDNIAKAMFTPIMLKGYKIGLTICYDCNHALFSRVYGIQSVDIILNSTGGNVIYDKWYKYNSARAIENYWYTFVTMGGDVNNEKVNSYVYGFNPNGKELHPVLLNGGPEQVNIPGEIYLYDTDADDNGTQADKSLNQKETVNKKQNFLIPIGNVESLLQTAKKVDDGLYVLEREKENVVFCVTKGDEIFCTEIFLPKLYSEKLHIYKNRRYILVCQYPSITKDLFANRLSLILKVRAMENYCAVILESDIENKCYQTGHNRTAQVIKPVSGFWGLDFSRMTGPEAIWKNKLGMRAEWRDKFVWLANECKSWSNGGR